MQTVIEWWNYYYNRIFSFFGILQNGLSVNLYFIDYNNKSNPILKLNRSFIGTVKIYVEVYNIYKK